MNKKLAGAQALDVLLFILSENPNITRVGFWAYSGDLPKPIGIRKKDIKWLSAEELFKRSILENIIKNLSPGTELGIFSKVFLSERTYAHIPMMDFRIPKMKKNISLIINRFTEVGNKNGGWILDSGRSFHYYGPKLLSTSYWKIFLGKCLITSIRNESRNYQEVADPRYIGYSLIEGGNVLRITANSGQKSPPLVVAQF